MKIDVDDAALELPPRDREYWGLWHWFWARVFGRRVATSGDRAHIGNLLVAYRPDLVDLFGKDEWLTDARRVHRIGALFIFDYGDTPIETIESPIQRPPRELDNESLLADNLRRYQQPERM